MPDNAILFDQIKKIFDRYGVPPSVWYPIALAESGMNPTAVGDNGDSIGIFQLNRRGGQGRGYSTDQLANPVLNASIAAPPIWSAYQSIKDQYPPNEWAAQVARRSGHPGGSINHPFPNADPRIQRIKTLAQSYLQEKGIQANTTGGIVDQLLGGGGALFQDIDHFLKTFDFIGLTMAGIGLLLIIIALILFAADSKKIKTVAKIAAKVA